MQDVQRRAPMGGATQSVQLGRRGKHVSVGVRHMRCRFHIYKHSYILHTVVTTGCMQR